MTDNLLKPCPFCGTYPVYKTERDMLPPHNSRAWIKCPKCHQAQVCSDWYGGDLGTTEACWNKRFDATDAPLESGWISKELFEMVCEERDNLQQLLNAAKEAMAIYGKRNGNAIAYLHGLTIFGTQEQRDNIGKAIEILEGKL